MQLSVTPALRRKLSLNFEDTLSEGVFTAGERKAIALAADENERAYMLKVLKHAKGRASG